MSNFPPALLVEGRRVPGSLEALKRLVRALDVQPGERVLLLGAGDGTSLRVLARDAGANVTAVEWDPKLVAALEARVRDEALSGRVTVRQGDGSGLPSQGFESVLVDTLPPPGSLTDFTAKLRELLVVNGRLGITLPVAVGLTTQEPVQAFWSGELGTPLQRPAATLGLIEKSGYEPQWAESLSDELMAEYYRLLDEQAQNAEPAVAERAKKAIELFRTGPGRTGASHAMLVARRREPGEKPPPARTAG